VGDVSSFAEFGLLPLFGVGETGKGNCNVGNGSSNGAGPISAVNNVAPILNNDLASVTIIPVGANQVCS
jgi:hypothetical protein